MVINIEHHGLLNELQDLIRELKAEIPELSPNHLEKMRFLSLELANLVKLAETQKFNPQEKAIANYLRGVAVQDEYGALFDAVGFPVPDYWFGDVVWHKNHQIPLKVRGLTYYPFHNYGYSLADMNLDPSNSVFYAFPEQLEKINEPSNTPTNED